MLMLRSNLQLLLGGVTCRPDVSCLTRTLLAPKPHTLLQGMSPSRLDPLKLADAVFQSFVALAGWVSLHRCSNQITFFGFSF